jgi:hypothetical protein
MENEGLHTTTIVILIGMFAPMILAIIRRHNSKLAISVLNIFAIAGAVIGFMTALVLGVVTFPFAGLCWFIALIWSLTGNVNRTKRRPRSVGVEAS